jgi:hypothetical protein
VEFSGQGEHLKATGTFASSLRQPRYVALLALAALALLTSTATAAPVRPHATFGEGAFTAPQSVAVDQSGGEVYVLDSGFPGTISRFDATGNPAPFSALAGSNVLNGSDAGSDADQTPQNGFAFFGSGSQIAVDASGGPTDGDIYVSDSQHGVVDVFAPSGAYLTQLTGSATPQGSFAAATSCGVATDPSGTLYVSTYAGQVNRYIPLLDPVADADYDSQISELGEGAACQLAADAAGRVYTAPFGSGPLKRFAAADFGSAAPAGTELAPSAAAIAVDPGSGDIYVDEGTQISHLDSAGAALEPPFGAPYLSGSSGVGAGSGNAYASGADAKAHRFGPALELAVDPATDLTTESATLNGHLNPGGVPTSYYFEYSGDEGVTWIPVPGFGNLSQRGPPCSPKYCPQPVDAGAGSADIPVSQSTDAALDREAGGVTPAKPISLQPNTTYRFRLRANGPYGESTSPESTFTTAALAPDAQTTGVELGVTTARLAARINPHNSPTTYFFQYATQSDFSDAVSVPTSEDAGAGTGNQLIEVSQPLTGLSAGTTYYYRVVAHSEAGGDATGATRTFTTLAALPPAPAGRGYEKVSPDDKGGFGVRHLAATRVVSPDGNRSAFPTWQPPPGAQSSTGASWLLADRTSTGWVTRLIDIPQDASQAGAEGAGILGFSESLDFSFDFSTQALTADAQEEKFNFFLRDLDTGQRQLLGSNTDQSGGNPYLATAVTDNGRVAVFTSTAQETADPVTPSVQNLYWARDGVIELAGVLPAPEGGGPPPQGSDPGAGLVRGNRLRALSRDGSRLVFNSPEFPESPSFQGQLYLREDDGSSPPRTIHLNASQRTDCADHDPCAGSPEPDPAGPLPALYWSAEADHGSKVLFSSCEKLTDDSTASVPSENPDVCKSNNGAPVTQRAGDLYMYDVATEHLEDLTTADPSGADVKGVVGTSEDLTSIYFVANGVLAPGAAPGNCTSGGGVATGICNLYLYRAGSTRYIASLRNSGGYRSGASLDSGAPSEQSNWLVSNRGDNVAAKGQVARVSPDGAHALITSYLPLTGYDNRNPAKCDSSLDLSFSPDHRCSEVFLYSAKSDHLTCVSCHEGHTPQGDAFLSDYAGDANAIGGLPRNLSDDGSRVFFESHDSLSPADVNEQLDVYMWENGTISLLSGGESGFRSFFFDASPSGDDVLFSTSQKLVASDRDENVDLYDARVGGGFPEIPPPVPCQGDQCQGSAPPAPFKQRSSTTLSGSGNAKPKKQRCGKDKIRRHGRCVAKRHKKPQKHRAANTNRGGVK